MAIQISYAVLGVDIGDFDDDGVVGTADFVLDGMGDTDTVIEEVAVDDGKGVTEANGLLEGLLGVPIGLEMVVVEEGEIDPMLDCTGEPNESIDGTAIEENGDVLGDALVEIYLG